MCKKAQKEDLRQEIDRFEGAKNRAHLAQEEYEKAKKALEALMAGGA